MDMLKGLVRTMRENTRWNIQQNPTTIIIQRTELPRSGGGRSKIETTLDPITVRITVASTKMGDQYHVTDPGIVKADPYYLIAEHDADIRAGTDVTDAFETNLGKFRIKTVYPQRMHGEIVGIQAGLERMS